MNLQYAIDILRNEYRSLKGQTAEYDVNLRNGLLDALEILLAEQQNQAERQQHHNSIAYATERAKVQYGETP